MSPATPGRVATKVRPTADVPFFINGQSYPLHVPTPNGSGIDIAPGQVVIGKYYNRCVDRTPRSQGGNRSVTPTYDAVDVELVKDPIGLLDGLMDDQFGLRKSRRAAKGREDGSDGERRGTPSLFNRTREGWFKYLVQASEEQILQDHGSAHGSLQKILRFLGADSPGKSAGKPALARALKAHAAATVGNA